MALRDLGTIIETDVLVIGGGIAALFAAIKAKEKDSSLDVLLVDKCTAGLSGCSAHAAGMLPYWEPGDDFDKYVEEIIVDNSEYLIDQDYVPQAVRQSYDRVHEMLDWGVQVQRDANGNPIRVPIIATSCGYGTPFIGGTQLTWKVRMQAAKRAASFMDRTFVTDLLMADGKCAGAVGFNVRSGEFYIFRARSTILANGTVFFGRRPQMGQGGTTGDAAAAVLRAGGQIRNMEQLWATHGPAALDSSGVHIIFGSGGIIRNAKGERIMEKYNPKLLELAKRYEVARGILLEWKEGRGPCYLDCSHLSPDKITHIKTSLPRLALALQRWGIDLAKDKIDWVPYGLTPQTVAGVRVSSGDGDVPNIPGLWSVGNASDFCGGADTTAVTALVGSANMGARAGARAAEHAAGTKTLPVDEKQVETLRNDLFAPMQLKASSMTHRDAATELSEVVHQHINLLKDEPRLKLALSELQELEDKFSGLAANDAHELMLLHGLKNKHLMAKVSAEASLLRSESRACHYRLDYPSRDDRNWLKWTIATLDQGKVKVALEDMPVVQWKYKPKAV